MELKKPDSTSTFKNLSKTPSFHYWEQPNMKNTYTHPQSDCQSEFAKTIPSRNCICSACIYYTHHIVRFLAPPMRRAQKHDTHSHTLPRTHTHTHTGERARVRGHVYVCIKLAKCAGGNSAWRWVGLRCEVSGCRSTVRFFAKREKDVVFTVVPTTVSVMRYAWSAGLPNFGLVRLIFFEVFFLWLVC